MTYKIKTFHYVDWKLKNGEVWHMVIMVKWNVDLKVNCHSTCSGWRITPRVMLNYMHAGMLLPPSRRQYWACVVICSVRQSCKLILPWITYDRHMHVRPYGIVYDQDRLYMCTFKWNRLRDTTKAWGIIWCTILLLIFVWNGFQLGDMFMLILVQ